MSLRMDLRGTRKFVPEISGEKLTGHRGSRYKVSFRTPLELTGWNQKSNGTSSEFTRYEEFVPEISGEKQTGHKGRVLDTTSTTGHHSNGHS